MQRVRNKQVSGIAKLLRGEYKSKSKKLPLSARNMEVLMNPAIYLVYEGLTDMESGEIPN